MRLAGSLAFVSRNKPLHGAGYGESNDSVFFFKKLTQIKNPPSTSAGTAATTLPLPLVLEQPDEVMLLHDHTETARDGAAIKDDKGQGGKGNVREYFFF